MPDRTCGGCGQILRGGAACPVCSGSRVPSPTKRAQGADYFKERSRVFSAAGVHRGEAECHWCGVPVQAKTKGEPVTATTATADHVLPVARGGEHEGNLVVACSSCNSRRRDQPGPPRPR